MLHCQCIETIWIREKRKGTPTYGVRTNEKTILLSLDFDKLLQSFRFFLLDISLEDRVFGNIALCRRFACANTAYWLL